MAEKNKSLLQRLREGEKILCEQCKKGYIIPFNTTPDKAHVFECSNADCDWWMNTIPAIPEMDEYLYGDLEE